MYAANADTKTLNGRADAPVAAAGTQWKKVQQAFS